VAKDKGPLAYTMRNVRVFKLNQFGGIFRSIMVHDIEEIQINNFQLQLQLTEVEGLYQSEVKVDVFKEGKLLKEEILILDGTTFLYSLENNDEGGTVAGFYNNLLISCGDSLLCYSVPDLGLQWGFKPGPFDLFEFYWLEGDILIRGESSVFRVNKSGEEVWSFTGNDIFVNNNGENEVQIFDSYILLTDADSKEYKIDFNGNAL